MFDRDTLFILGAGASKDYNFPLGHELKQQVSNLAHTIAVHPTSLQVKPAVSIDRDQINLIANELDQIKASQVDVGFSTDRQKHFEFATRLNESKTSTTIDSFLRDHPTLANLGRFYIALELFSRTYQQPGRGKGITVADNILSPHVRNNWYPKFIAELRDGCTSPSELEASAGIDIVTFNYDRSLEHYLEHEFDNTELHRGADYRKIVRFHYMYGSLPMLETGKRDHIGPWLLNAAIHSYSDIQILGERSTDSIVSEVRNVIQKAQHVTIIGFGFDQENCRQLRIPEVLTRSRLYLHNFATDSPSYRGISHLFEDWLRVAQDGKRYTTPSEHRPLVGDAAYKLAHTLENRRIFFEPISDSITAGLFRTK